MFQDRVNNPINELWTTGRTITITNKSIIDKIIDVILMKQKTLLKKLYHSKIYIIFDIWNLMFVFYCKLYD